MWIWESRKVVGGPSQCILARSLAAAAAEGKLSFTCGERKPTMPMKEGRKL